MNGAIFFYSTNGDGSIEWIGSVMIWVLLALSVANIVLIAIAAAANRRRDMLPEGEVRELRELLSGGRYQEAIERARRSESDLAHIVIRTLDHAPDGTDAMGRASEQAADELLTFGFFEEVLNRLSQADLHAALRTLIQTKFTQDKTAR